VDSASTPAGPARTEGPSLRGVSRGRAVFVGALVLLANCAILALQLVSSRLFAPAVEASLATWTSAIGVVLARTRSGRVGSLAPSGPWARSGASPGTS